MKRILSTLFICAFTSIAVNAQQHKLWYSKPASHWLEALPIGNSHLGAMVYGGTDIEQIQLNEETFWSGSPHENNNPSAKVAVKEVRKLIFAGQEEKADSIIGRTFFKGPHGQKFLPLGDLSLKFNYQSNSEPTNYRRELNLEDAVCTTTFKNKLNGVTYTREVFASQADNVIVMRLKADKKGKLDFSLAHWCSGLKNSSHVKDGELVATVQNVEQEGIPGGLTAEIRALVKSDGQWDNTPDMIVVKGATEATIYITAATNFVNYQDISGHPSEITQQTIASVSDKNYKEL